MSSTRKKSDHQRVIDILHRVDLTAEQRLVNQELRDAVLDAEDTVCMLQQQLRIHELNNDCVAAVQVAQQRLARFENEISYAHSTTRQEDEQYARECGLLVDGKLFLSEEMRLTSLRGIDVARDRLSSIAETFRSISSTSTSEMINNNKNQRPVLLPRGADLAVVPKTESSSSSSTSSQLAKCFVEGALVVLDQAELVAIENKLDTNPWANVLESALESVATMVRQNAGALDPLKSISAKISELKWEARNEMTKQESAIESGDVAKSEEHVKSRLVLLEGISGLILQKLTILSQIESGPLVRALKETEKAREHLSNAATEVFERQDAHLENLESDCERLEQYQARAKQNEQEARSVFLEQRAHSDSFLAENLKKQTQCWKELLRIEAQLSALAEERREEVERRVRNFEREERRRCDMGHFANFADTRQKQLSRAIDNIITEKRVGAALADIVDKAVFTLSEEVNVMQNAVREAKKAMLEEHAGHFREQYLTVGELLFRKERLLEECDKKIVELRMQQEIAMDTLDPKARLISENRSALEQQREEVLQFVKLLRAKSEMYVDAFRPSDTAIRSTTGISTSFNATEAMEELRAQNEARSRVLDEYFTHMTVETAKAEDALGRPKPNGEMRFHPKLLMSQAEIAAELAEIAATREVVAENRRKTFEQLALSPDTDPALRAKRWVARKMSVAMQQQQQQDPPDTLMNTFNNSENKLAASSFAIEKNLDGKAKTPSPTRRAKKKSTTTVIVTTTKTDNQKQNHQVEKNANDAIQSSLPQGTSGKKNIVAERLSAALRISSLGLNNQLEPYEGRALSQLDKINKKLENQKKRAAMMRRRRLREHQQLQTTLSGGKAKIYARLDEGEDDGVDEKTRDDGGHLHHHHHDDDDQMNDDDEDDGFFGNSSCSDDEVFTKEV